jgi:hypothetical protein
MRTALGLIGQVDWDMVLSLAKLYDKDLTTKPPTGKKPRPLAVLLGARKP